MANEQQALADLGEYVASIIADDLHKTEVVHGELTITISSAAVARVMAFLRDDPSCKFQMLMDITAVDWPDRDPRFDVVYNLLSIGHNQRIRVKLQTDEETPVASIIALFPAAGWYEREIWDLFGIPFSDHPDLRRLLTDYGFEGHPLRKDFPLTGFVELRYNEDQKRVVYEPVSLTQEFRSFDFLSPWEGMTNVMLPGDEKAHGPITGSAPR